MPLLAGEGIPGSARERERGWGEGVALRQPKTSCRNRLPRRGRGNCSGVDVRAARGDSCIGSGNHRDWRNAFFCGCGFGWWLLRVIRCGLGFLLWGLTSWVPYSGFDSSWGLSRSFTAPWLWGDGRMSPWELLFLSALVISPGRLMMHTD